jgi:succinate dehydrogenase / fumarate reductase cytochrome b subunit
MNSKTDTLKPRPRPLSPHLQVYSWLITSTLSILHRLTGVVLSFGLLLIVAWIVTAAYAPETYDQVNTCLSSIYGKIILIGFSLALFYHLCNGIRHLFWDMGKGFELKTVTATGVTVILTALTLTALVWL